MNRITEVEIGGKTFALNYSVKAMITLSEIYGGSPQDVIRALLPETENRNNAIFSSAVMHSVAVIGSTLMEYGVKYRKLFEGTDCPALNTEAIECLGIPEYITLYTAVLNALPKGNKREIEAENNSKNAEATQGV